MKLKPGCYPQYKEAHDKLWPEIGASMRENGVNMAIYRQSDDHLFVHATAHSKEHWERSRLDAAMPRWQAAMAKLIETDERGEVIYEELSEAFLFGDFKASIKDQSAPVR